MKGKKTVKINWIKEQIRLDEINALCGNGAGQREVYCLVSGKLALDADRLEQIIIYHIGCELNTSILEKVHQEFQHTLQFFSNSDSKCQSYLMKGMIEDSEVSNEPELLKMVEACLIIDNKPLKQHLTYFETAKPKLNILNMGDFRPLSESSSL